MSDSRGVYMLSPDHAAALSSLAGDWAIATRLGVANASKEGLQQAIGEKTRAREAGKEYTYVILDDGKAVGVCGLSEVDSETPVLFVTIAVSQRGRGHAGFATNNMLQLAFENLRLERIGADAPLDCPDWKRFLSRFGFELGANGYRLTREQWQHERTAAVLRVLHPLLVPLLEAELRAGNEVAESSSGKVDEDGLFVRLKQPFMARPAALPTGVKYSESNDPHWWKAEYRSTAPIHVIASG